MWGSSSPLFLGAEKCWTETSDEWKHTALKQSNHQILQLIFIIVLQHIEKHAMCPGGTDDSVTDPFFDVQVRLNIIAIPIRFQRLIYGRMLRVVMETPPLKRGTLFSIFFLF
jgi:hypothetical protein